MLQPIVPADEGGSLGTHVDVGLLRHDPAVSCRLLPLESGGPPYALMISHGMKRLCRSASRTSRKRKLAARTASFRPPKSRQPPPLPADSWLFKIIQLSIADKRPRWTAGTNEAPGEHLSRAKQRDWCFFCLGLT
jgi:hypothetical protein